MRWKTPLALVAIMAFLAIHDLCVAEVDVQPQDAKQARGEEAVEGGRDAVTEGYRLCPDGSVPCTCGAYGPSHGTYRRHEEQDVQLSYRGGKPRYVNPPSRHCCCPAPGCHGAANFNFTGAPQNFTVPACVKAGASVFIQAWGAEGGPGQAGGAGGLGGYAEGRLLVAPGDVLSVFVGGQGANSSGGFNGGGNGGNANAEGGGGASDVRVGGVAETNRVITAGGGGGGGRGGCDNTAGGAGAGVGGAGGAGGGGVGNNGNNSLTPEGVAGGGSGGNFGDVQGVGGTEGVGCASFLGATGSTASTGTGAVGGAGQTCCCQSGAFTTPGGGGGGGGQVGGGGGGGGSAGTTNCSGNSKGAGGGGGGGSSFTGGVLPGVTTNGTWSGDGMVTITW